MAFGPVAMPGDSMNTPAAYIPPDNQWAAKMASPTATRATQVIGNTQLALLNFGDILRQSGWGGPNAVNTWATEGAYPIYFNVTEHTYMLFQLMFAIITVALISGSVIGKY